MYFTALYPYVILTIFLVLGLTLEGDEVYMNIKKLYMKHAPKHFKQCYFLFALSSNIILATMCYEY